jgi:hypothetical protein
MSDDPAHLLRPPTLWEQGFGVDLRPYRANTEHVYREAQDFAEAFARWRRLPAGADDWQPVMDAFERWELAQNGQQHICIGDSS